MGEAFFHRGSPSLPLSVELRPTPVEEGLRMESLLAAGVPRTDPAAELIDLSCPEDPFQKMKACSVVTYGEATLMRLPWSGLHRKNEPGITSIALDFEEAPGGPPRRWSVSSRDAGLIGTYERSVFRALEW